MSNFVNRLVQRVIAPETLLQPRTPSLFEEGNAAAFSEITAETIAAQPPSRAGVVHTSGVPVNQVPRSLGPSVPRSSQPSQPSEQPRTRGTEEPKTTEIHEHVVTNEVHTRETHETEREHTRTILPRNITTAPPAAPRIAIPAPERVETAQAERDVHITIGRIDVRAVTPAAPKPRQAKTPRTLTLDEYLDQRSRR